jgi:orotidine-5'-phosphate decarboxylase
MEDSHFADRLAAAVRRKRTPLIVGLDPRWELLPESLQAGRGEPEVVAASFGSFCRGVIDAVAPLVPAVKPQWAFFEQLGSAGIRELERIVGHARAAGLLVIADAKRGDIGSTAEAYAEAFFRMSETVPFVDALTVNPYLGRDSWAPFVDLAKARGGGIFVLAKTSNPGSGDLQDLTVDSTRVYERVADQIEAAAIPTVGECGYGIVGAVVGATYPEQLACLRRRMPHAWFLVPGFGAQGGTARDVAGAFDARGLGAIVNSARGIIFAHRDAKSAGRDWQHSVEAACREAIEQLRAATPRLS